MPEHSTISFATALRFWLKLGFISFGGPTGQIAIMHEELVERRKWISERRFLHALNFCMALPGPEAQQLATYIGWLMHGTRGGIAAGALFVLPSLMLLIGLSWLYLTFGATPTAIGILDGMKPAVVAIVICAAYRIGSRVLTNGLAWLTAAAAFVALAVFDAPFPLVIVSAGILGIAMFRFDPHLLGAERHTKQTASLIDDEDETPVHARFRWKRSLQLVALSVVIWCSLEGLLVAMFGWNSTFAQMGWFFTKAALLTFGGAYAVLPYVQQAAIEQYGWLTAGQMIDGLALGETTPGPLIMVVAFVGFVGGWTHAALGHDALVAAGILAASIATLFTFLPSFAFILIGAPIVEATRGEMLWNAPLALITAAVVGVILNLAVFFAEHVFWRNGWPGFPTALAAIDLFAVIVCVAAVVALTRLKANVVVVIVGCAFAGWLRTALMQ